MAGIVGVEVGACRTNIDQRRATFSSASSLHDSINRAQRVRSDSLPSSNAKEADGTPDRHSRDYR